MGWKYSASNQDIAREWKIVETKEVLIFLSTCYRWFISKIWERLISNLGFCVWGINASYDPFSPPPPKRVCLKTWIYIVRCSTKVKPSKIIIQATCHKGCLSSWQNSSAKKNLGDISDRNLVLKNLETTEKLLISLKMHFSVTIATKNRSIEYLLLNHFQWTEAIGL